MSQISKYNTSSYTISHVANMTCRISFQVTVGGCHSWFNNARTFRCSCLLSCWPSRDCCCSRSLFGNLMLWRSRRNGGSASAAAVTSLATLCTSLSLLSAHCEQCLQHHIPTTTTCTCTCQLHMEVWPHRMANHWTVLGMVDNLSKHANSKHTHTC